MKQYAKAFIAAAGAGLTAAAEFVAPGSTWAHVLTVALAVCTVLGVYIVPNARPVPASAAHLTAR